MTSPMVVLWFIAFAVVVIGAALLVLWAIDSGRKAATASHEHLVALAHTVTALGDAFRQDSQEFVTQLVAGVTGQMGDVNRQILANAAAAYESAQRERETMLRAIIAGRTADYATLERIANERERITGSTRGDTIDGDPRRHMTEEEYLERVNGTLVDMGYRPDQIVDRPLVPEGL